MFSGQSLWFNVLIQPDEKGKRRSDFRSPALSVGREFRLTPILAFSQYLL